MAEIAAAFLGPALKVVKLVGAPILRQFSYLCCFSSNITSLKNETEKLQVKERDLQGKVDAARNDVQVISGEVEVWLENSKNIKDETDGILNEVPNVEGGCLKLRARFSLSRRAKKTTDRLKELRDQCEFNDNSISLPGPPPATMTVPSESSYEFKSRKQIEEDIMNSISLPGPPPATMAVPSESSYEFKSRKQIEEDIMTTLRGVDVNMIGICGMGGLGKTTMAKKIWNRVLEEHVFEEVVMAVVSQPIDKLKIQLEIGGSLGLKLTKEDALQARVRKLHQRLSGTKRTLVVLDDVWKPLKLEDLGIPHGYKGCTILLTSRSRDVLSGMDLQKIFRMELLSEEDSWFLFKEKVGTHADDTKLNSIAKEVVNECGRLPIALITVGSALKDKVNVSAWKSALRQLKRHDPDIPDFIKKVYNPLELSYDVLEHKYQLVFLLCCLYPEDADIPLERLTYFCMGLRLFERGLVEERDRMHSLIDVLKDRSLLLDSNKGDDYVRMHDVVRDVCIFIARKNKYISGSLLLDSNKGDDYVRMHDVVRDVCIFIARKNKYISGGDSSLQRYEFDPGYALLQICNSSDQEIKFDEIRALYVLSIERCSQLTSLPFTQRPNNLITLVLDSCKGLKTLSVVGELVNLEILICRDCNSIEELPLEIQGLNRLKVLDLTSCGNLKRIGRGIISSLVGLEELKMLRSFKKWEGEDREERKNAGLRELEALTNLRCLEIEIEDLALAAENIRLSSEVDRFTIRFSCQRRWFPKFGEYLSNKKMLLNLEVATCLGDWIKVQLLRDTECLLLVGNGANEVGLTDLEKKIRYLGECESMKKVVTSSMDKGGATVFPSIEHLLLFNLPKLEEICDDRISSNSFQNLKILQLVDLPVLKQLWMSSQNDLGKDFLPQLEDLYIRNCGMMETVFLWKGEDGNENTSCHHITKIFPKLKELWLVDLPNLISLCQGIEGIEFPLLREIKIRGCGEMKGMVANGVTNNENNSGGTHHIFCESRVSFGCLKQLNTDRNPFCCHTIRVSLLNGLEELEISNCAGSRSLFTSSMAGNLRNLKELRISECEDMVEVIKDDEEKGLSCGRQRALLFPKLQTIKLWTLPNLLSFCEWKWDVEFPSLRKVGIHNCPNMKNFTFGSLAAPNLESFETDLKDYLLQVLPFNIVKQLSVQGSEKPLLVGNGANEVGLTNLNKLRCLELGECESMKQVVTSSMDDGGAIVFPFIEHLVLFKLPKLEEICDHRILLNSFQNLKTLKLDDLPVLKQLWKSSQNDLGKDFLPQLEVLEIRNCEMMEVVFLWKGEDRNENNSCHLIAKVFPKLKELELVGLPNLISFCQGIKGIEFPLLRRMEINECGKMKGMVSNEGGLPNLEKIRCLELGECESMKKVVTSSMDDGGTIVFPSIEHLMLFKLPKLEEICDDRILLNSFQNLKTLKLDDLPILKQLWKSSQNDLGKDLLPQLEVLEIRNCEMMEVVFLWKGEDRNENNSCHHIIKIFPKLEELELVGLPNLINFCQGIEGIEFPLLRRMEINECGKMKGMVSNENNSRGSSSNASIHGLFCPQEVSFDRLKKVDTDWNPFSEIEELTSNENNST